MNKLCVEVIENKKLSFISFQNRINDTHKIMHLPTQTIFLFSEDMTSLISVNFQYRNVLKKRRTQTFLKYIT